MPIKFEQSRALKVGTKRVSPCTSADAHPSPSGSIHPGSQSWPPANRLNPCGKWKLKKILYHKVFLCVFFFIS